jgi:hypothetical protein
MAKKKARDDDRDDRDDRADADDAPKSDAYVGLLGITLAAVLAGAVLMFLDHGELEEGAKAVQAPAVNASPDGLEFKVVGQK